MPIEQIEQPKTSHAIPVQYERAVRVTDLIYRKLIELSNELVASEQRMLLIPAVLVPFQIFQKP